MVVECPLLVDLPGTHRAGSSPVGGVVTVDVVMLPATKHILGEGVEIVTRVLVTIIVIVTL